MFEAGGNPLDTFSVFRHCPLKSISLASVDTIHQTPCKHVRESVWQCSKCTWEWPSDRNCVFLLYENNRFECPDMMMTCARPYLLQC